MKSYIYTVIILLFISNCTLNKVVNHHGVHFLEKKYQKITNNNNNNKNDIFELLGPPSTNSDFNENIWIYIERSKISSRITKLGEKVLVTNTIVVIEFDNRGIVKDKTLFDKNDINNMKFVKETTTESLRNKDIVYEVLSGIGKRIDDPLGKKKARAQE
jgi:outer membrane protein assembly factor BamE (lipoprotein component of BamABCDE complex)